jgi:hypothetical protein
MNVGVPTLLAWGTLACTALWWGEFVISLLRAEELSFGIH